MNVLTIRTQIRELPKRLKAQWCPYGRWTRIVQKEPDTQKIHAAVCVLDLETATLEDVETTMGFSGSWVEVPICDECRREVDGVVQLGETPSYESATANVCLDCLRKAVDLIVEAK